MSRKFRFIFLMMCTAIMVMAMTVSVFAKADQEVAYYEVGQPVAYSSPISIKLVIDTKKVGNMSSAAVSQVYDVTINADMDGVTGVTVRDAILAWIAQGNNVAVFDHGGNFGTNSTVVSSMSIGNNTYAPNLPLVSAALDGFSFRVNGKFPLLTTSSPAHAHGPEGAYVHQTPVSDGDVIHFYWNYPYNKTPNTYYSANYVSATPAYNSTTDTLNIQLVRSFDYEYNDGFWHILPFANTSCVPAGTYNYTIWQKGQSTAVSSGTVDFNNGGVGAITGLNLSAGNTYYLQIDTQSYKAVYHSVLDEDVYIVDNTKVFEPFSINA